MTDTQTTQNYYNTAAAWVAAEPAVTVEPARADLVKRADVVHVVDRMIDGYMTQQRHLLDQVQGQTVGAGRGGFLSDADQVAERRQTSKMYLRHNLLTAALLTGGLSYLGYVAGADGALAIAAWIAATGGLSLVLAHRSHAKEFDHSPEGIARHVIDAHWAVTSYEAETRRKAIEWEHEAGERRQAAAAAAAEHNRLLAETRLAEIQQRRAITEAQRQPQVHDQALQFVVVGQPEEADMELLSDAKYNATSSQTSAATTWQHDLLSWVTSLYEPGAVTAKGIIRQRAPWSERSSWVEADKVQAKRVCTEYRPRLIEPAPGGQWRLRLEMFPTVDVALQHLSIKLSSPAE